MSARTAAEIEADLVAFRALRTKAATQGGIAEYSFDSGQGRQSVVRIRLPEIQQAIRDLEAELLALSQSGPTCLSFDRGGA